mgnify:FL=1
MENFQKIAVLIDADNTQLSKLEAVLHEVSAYGRIVVKKAYGNWRKDSLKNWEPELKRLAIRAEQQFDYVAGKNTTDIAMVIGAMDLLHNNMYDALVLVSSDSDFTPLAIRLRESGLYIIGAGVTTTPESFKNACDDFILIDCPPSLELLTINALVAADSVLIPVQCEYYALEGIADLMRSIKMCNKRLNPELTVQGIVMTMYDGRTKLSDQVVNEVRKFFGKKVYKTMIPRNVRLSEAPSHRKPAIAYDKESKGARAYLHLAGELIKREEKAAKAAEAAAAAAAAEVEYG